VEESQTRQSHIEDTKGMISSCCLIVTQRATSGSGTDYLSRAAEFTPGYL
jgi:hypothetical protein